MIMLSRTRLATLVLLLGAGTLAYAAIRPASQDGQDGPPQPTAHHKMLLGSVGEWSGTMKMMMPGMPPQEIPCQETISPIGSMWTQSRFTCDFMGQPFVGSATTGYDVAKQKFVGTWIDSMSTEIYAMEGTFDAEKKVLHMSWEGPDMSTGERVRHRSETSWTDDTYSSHMFQGEGEGVKTMEFSMKRQAKGGEKKAAK
jgi:hypothetical protein